MNDEEYFGKVKPKFEPIDLDNAIACLDIHHDINQTNRFRRWWSNYKDIKVMERGEERSKMSAAMILNRILLYQDSWEFVDKLDLHDDFHIHNSVANMHLWLITQRLRDFANNKFAY